MCYNLTAIMTVLEQNRLAAVPKKKQKLLSLRMPAKSDRAIQGAMIVLSVYGLLMIASASMGLAVNNQRYLLLVVLKQIVFLAAGYYAMCFFARRFSLKYLQSSKFPPLAIGMGFALMACLVFPEVNGARAWIRVPVSSVDISIQPSEFAKIMTYLIIAAYCGDVRTRYPRGRDIWKRPLIFIFSYLIIIAAFQSDAGSAAVIVLIAAFCMLIPANKQLKPIQGLIAGLLILGIVFFLFLMTDQGVALIEKLPLKEYQKNRFLSSINPFIDRYNTGYQLVNGQLRSQIHELPGREYRLHSRNRRRGDGPDRLPADLHPVSDHRHPAVPLCDEDEKREGQNHPGRHGIILSHPLPV